MINDACYIVFVILTYACSLISFFYIFTQRCRFFSSPCQLFNLLCDIILCSVLILADFYNYFMVFEVDWVLDLILILTLITYVLFLRIINNLSP